MGILIEKKWMAQLESSWERCQGKPGGDRAEFTLRTMLSCDLEDGRGGSWRAAEAKVGHQAGTEEEEWVLCAFILIPQQA